MKEGPRISDETHDHAVRLYQQGRSDMRQEIIDIIRPCLARDFSLQKIIRAIEEMK